MADLSELLAAEARRLEPTDPPPFEQLLGTRRSRDRRNRLAVGTSMLVTVGGIAVTASLLGPARYTLDTAAPPPRHEATTSTSSPSVTARITLSATTVRAGETLTGQITVANTGGEIRVVGCGSIYQVSLVGGDQKGAPPSAYCLQHFTIPKGITTYPVTVAATYRECSPKGDQGMPACLPNGKMPGLPPGRYAATAWGVTDQVTVPAPISVTVKP